MTAAKPCVLITCGPGYEPVDAVRRLTNFSTGGLGAELAARFLSEGWRVILFRGEMASVPAPDGADVWPFSTGADLLQKLRSQISGPGHDVRGVFHAAALSDFQVRSAEGSCGYIPVGRGKIPTAAGRLTLHLEPAPKILPELRTLFPTAFIAGWKYEVEGGRAAALEKGAGQIRACRTDVCVVNGPAFGPGFGVLDREGALEEARDAAALFALLLGRLRGHTARGS